MSDTVVCPSAIRRCRKEVLCQGKTSCCEWLHLSQRRFVHNESYWRLQVWIHADQRTRIAECKPSWLSPLRVFLILSCWHLLPTWHPMWISVCTWRQCRCIIHLACCRYLVHDLEYFALWLNPVWCWRWWLVGIFRISPEVPLLAPSPILWVTRCSHFTMVDYWLSRDE